MLRRKTYFFIMSDLGLDHSMRVEKLGQIMIKRIPGRKTMAEETPAILEKKVAYNKKMWKMKADGVEGHVSNNSIQQMLSGQTAGEQPSLASYLVLGATL